MTDNIPVVSAFAVALALPVMIWSARRFVPETWGDASLIGDFFAAVLVAVASTRYAAIPALQWL